MHHYHIIWILTVFFSIFLNPAVNGQGTGSEPEAVGSIGGSLDVTPTGAATFTIPIEIPAGVGGMQPSIAIAYNSQGGNGIVGWGCNISGISVITRVPKSIHYDGNAKGLTYSKDDGFMLNGQRLLYSGPVENGAAGSYGYFLESDPFTTVVLQGAYDYRMRFWFEIQTKDGMKYHYGKNTGKQLYRILDLSTGYDLDKVNAWYLDYVEDIYGNYMNYNYEVSNSCLYLQSIVYGKNRQNQALESTLSFTYETRPDSIPFWIENARGTMNKRLTKIVSKTGNTTFREYQFAYANTDHFSRLTSVTLKNGSGEALKPTTLRWNYLPAFTQECKLPYVSEASVYPSVDHIDQAFVAADMNGDGLCDLVGIFPSTEFTDNGVSSVTKVVTYRASIENGKYEFHSAGYQNYPSFAYKDIKHVITGQTVGDLDGDGQKDVLLVAYDDWAPFPKSAVFYSTKQSSIPIASHEISSPLNGTDTPIFTLADINNDGKDEIISLERNYTEKTRNEKYMLRIKFWNNQLWWSMLVKLYYKPKNIFAADFNGDGLTDIMIVSDQSSQLYWNKGNTDGTNFLLEQNEFTVSAIDDSKMLRLGDFNGDGLPDFLMNNSDDPNWYFALNVGNGSFQKKLACTLDIYDHGFTDDDDDQFSCHVFDFDFDGKSDVVITKAMYEKVKEKILGITIGTYGKHTNTYTYWMRSTGSSLVEKQHKTYEYWYDAYSKYIVAGDFDGDGRVELMEYANEDLNYEYKWRLFKNPNIFAGSSMLASTTDGFGNKTEVTYSTLAEKKIYTKGYGAQYPMVDISLPISMVKSVKTDNGVAETAEIQYEYANAKAHVAGKGFLWMGSHTATNVTTGEKVKTIVNRYNLNWYAPEETYTQTIIDKKTAQTTVKLRYVEKSDKGCNNYLVFPATKTEKDLDGQTVTSTYTYDDTNGNITRDSTSFAKNMYQVVRYSNYIQAGGTVADKPGFITVIRKHFNDDEKYVKKTSFGYHPQMGYVTQKIENYGTTQQLITSMPSRDIYGNLCAWTISGSGIPAMEYTHNYTNGRFVNKKYTYPESTTIKYTHDTWGNILTETDETDPANQLTNTHTYDGWGRRTSTMFPDGREIRYATGWNNDPKKRYYTLTQATGAPWEKTWYDQVGRKVEVETVGVKGTPIKSAYTFNNKGELTRTETIAGDLTTWEDVTYDERGRVKTQNNSSGQDISYEYKYLNGLKEIKTIAKTSEGNRTTTKTFDAGYLTSVTDPGGTVDYQYKSVGSPGQINGPNASYSITYDEAGNQKTLKDPDAGTYSYTYDALGRVLTQKDGKEQTQTNVYDKLGRIQYSTLEAERTDYTYGTTGNSKMRLVKVKTGNNSVDYTYDNFGRMFTETRTIEGEGTLSFTYEYNGAGLLKSTTYPGQVAVNYEYDAYGNLIQVKAGSQPVWTLNTTGLTTTSSLAGGNITAKTIINSEGLLTNLKTERGDLSIRDFGYTFNGVTGNLESRTGMIGSEEKFFYDDANRLTSIKHGGTEVMAMDYYPDGTGNIQNKTGLGKFYYGNRNAGPHALTEVENPTELINLRGQEIGYTPFSKALWLKDTIGTDAYRLDIMYGPDQQRWKTILKKNGSETKKIIFAGEYEKVTENEVTQELYYIAGGEGLAAVYVRQTGQADQIYYAHNDHLGSIVSLTDGDGEPVFKATYDAWGNQTITNHNFKFHRGYTGHEHLPEFGLINMNGRMYDPIVGRFLSPDPFVQAPDFSQNFNRYSYALNNPLIYTDPSGEIVWVPVIIGAVIGAYSGYKIADAKGYSFKDGSMYGYILGGAVIGGLAGYAGATIAAEGGFMAKTMGIMYSSVFNSMGMSALSGGMIQPSISFGAASYNFGTGEWGYLGKKGNSVLENIGYGFGALANMSDAVSLFRGGGQNVKVNSAKTKGVDVNGDPNEWWGHSAITDENGNRLVSFGPDSPVGKSTSLSDTWNNSIKGAKLWDTYLGQEGTWSVELNNVSTTALSKYASGITRWDLLLNSCVGHTSRALWSAGVPNIYLFHPHLLNAQLLLMQYGIFASPYLYQIPR
jgi:RHS repeat-associated protein